MITIRIGAGKAQSVREVLDWLENNVGGMLDRSLVTAGVVYKGIGWHASWRQYGAGWFMDVTLIDPKLADFFILRWK